MKNTIILLSILLTTVLQAQVAIGKTTVDGTDTILDFGADDNKGIVLPWIATTDIDSNTSGTLYYDTTLGKVMCTTTGGTTIDYSVKGLNTSFDATDPERHGYYQYNEVPTTVYGTVIGAEDTTKKGVLVLEEPTTNPVMAMILPKVTSYANIGDPEPGTIVYDSTIKMFCAFDGEQWSFWGK